MNIKKTIRKWINLFHSHFADDVYNIGIVPHSDDILTCTSMPAIKWLSHTFNDRWFADPFIVAEDTDTYTIFVETYYYDVRKGAIGVIVADKKDFKLQSYKDILVLSTHLSFPCYYYENGELFVYPENSNSGNNTLYRYDWQKQELIKIAVQCNYPWTDAAIMSDDRKWITTTYRQDCNRNICHVFFYDDFNKRYIHKHDIVLLDNTARGAGLPFMTVDGRLIRPAQNCNNGYGLGLVFQEMTIDDDKLILKEINRLYPNDKKYDTGLHTYNRFGNVAIVDGYQSPSKFGVWCWSHIRKVIERAR